MLKILFKGCKRTIRAHKLIRVDPAASNSDTVVDSAVTVYQIHLDKGWANYGLRGYFAAKRT